jgi:Yippee zinc-binding/DNA-binding /Mis18, centromere assembly
VSEAGCVQCGAHLAGSEEAIEVDGRREHRLANAAGIAFLIRCYAHAPGCVASGPTTDEDTWFAGHTWQRAFCRRCAAHVGWLFRSKSRVFWALL